MKKLVVAFLFAVLFVVACPKRTDVVPPTTTTANEPKVAEDGGVQEDAAK